MVSAARGSKPVAAPPVLWGSARRTASALPKRLPSAALRDVEWHDLLAGLSVEYNLFQNASKIRIGHSPAEQIIGKI